MEKEKNKKKLLFIAVFSVYDLGPWMSVMPAKEKKNANKIAVV